MQPRTSSNTQRDAMQRERSLHTPWSPDRQPFKWIHPRTVAVLGTTCSSTCFAAAPLLFDPRGILWAALYFAFLILVLIGVLLSRKGYLLLIVMIGLPLLWFASDISLMHFRDSQANSATLKMEEGLKRDREAFERFCRTPTRRTITPTGPIPASEVPNDGVIAIIFSRKSEVSPYDANAHAIALGLQAKSSECRRTGLTFVEGEYRIHHPSEEPQIRSYKACDKSDGEIKPYVTARYELVIGETIEMEYLPWESYGKRRMTKESAKLTDRRTKQVLAASSIFSPSDHAKDSDCPTVATQITDLIYAVFEDNSKP